MAAVYIFEGIDERKQLERAEQVSALGFFVEVHYHKSWVLKLGTDGLQHIHRIDCNEKCFNKGGDNGALPASDEGGGRAP